MFSVNNNSSSINQNNQSTISSVVGDSASRGLALFAKEVLDKDNVSFPKGSGLAGSAGGILTGVTLGTLFNSKLSKEQQTKLINDTFRKKTADIVINLDKIKENFEVETNKIRNQFKTRLSSAQAEIETIKDAKTKQYLANKLKTLEEGYSEFVTILEASNSQVIKKGEEQISKLQEVSSEVEASEVHSGLEFVRQVAVDGIKVISGTCLANRLPIKGALLKTAVQVIVPIAIGALVGTMTNPYASTYETIAEVAEVLGNKGEKYAPVKEMKHQTENEVAAGIIGKVAENVGKAVIKKADVAVRIGNAATAVVGAVIDQNRNCAATEETITQACEQAVKENLDQVNEKMKNSTAELEAIISKSLSDLQVLESQIYWAVEGEKTHDEQPATKQKVIGNEWNKMHSQSKDMDRLNAMVKEKLEQHDDTKKYLSYAQYGLSSVNFGQTAQPQPHYQTNWAGQGQGAAWKGEASSMKVGKIGATIRVRGVTLAI